MTGLQLTTDTRGGWHVVSLRGRIDSMTADELTAALRAAVAAHRQVAVDCSDVEFISSAGLHSFWEGARAARSAEREFRLCAPSPRVKQILEVSRMRDLLNVHEGLPC